MFLINKSTIFILVAVFVILLVIFIFIQYKLTRDKNSENKEEHSSDFLENSKTTIPETSEQVEVPTADKKEEIVNVVKEVESIEISASQIKSNDSKQAPHQEKENINKVQTDETKETTNLENLSIEVDEPLQNKRKGKYEIFKDSGFYRYRLKASNGEILIESELYETEKAVTEAVEIVRKNVENGIYSIVEDKSDSYQYKLSSRNHRTLVVSTSYSTKKGAEDAKDAFRRNALTDVVVMVKESKKVSKGSMEIYNDTSSVLDDKGLYEVIPNGKKFYFTLKNSKGVVICKSEDYVSKTSCITGLESFRNVVYEGVFYICKDKNGKFQYKLYNKQNKLVVTGDLLETKAKVQTVIRHVRKFAKLSKLG